MIANVLLWTPIPNDERHQEQGSSAKHSRVICTFELSLGHFSRKQMEISQQAHDVNTTSPQRRCNVMTLHRRWADVV